MFKSSFIPKLIALGSLALALPLHARETSMQTVASLGSAVDSVRSAFQDIPLQGKVFISSCQSSTLLKVKTLGTVKSFQVTYQFNGDSVTRSTRYYPTHDCAGDVMFTFEESGTVVIHTDQKTSDNARFMDRHFTKVIGIANSDLGAAAARSAKLCGSGDWGRGTTRDVTLQAANENCYSVPEIPRDVYDVYRLEDGVLILGVGLDDEEANSPNQRPTQLDRTEVFRTR